MQHAHCSSSCNIFLQMINTGHAAPVLGRALFRRRHEFERKRSLRCARALDTCTLIAVTSNWDNGMYQLGQSMNQIVLNTLSEPSVASYGTVLLAGLLTSLSPCTLSVLPLTIGYIGGYADADDGQLAHMDSNGSIDNSSIISSIGRSSSSSSSSGGSSSSSISTSSSSNAGATVGSAASSVTEEAAGTNAIPGCSNGNRDRESSNKGNKVVAQAVCFSLGLASSLSCMGFVSSLAGKAYGQTGNGLPMAVALVAIIMGLNLLQVVQVPLPSVDVDVRGARLPPPVMAYLAGALFALAASPCSTPVLATLLAYVSSKQDPVQAALLLLLYSCGYVSPLLVAASATGAAKQLLSLREYSAWITPTSGVLLVAGGTYALLARMLPTI